MKTLVHPFKLAHCTFDYSPVEYPERPRNVRVTFADLRTGARTVREYKTLPAAKAAVTRYMNALM